MLDEILRHFAADSLFGRLRPYARGDLGMLEAEVVRGFGTIPRARQQLVERTLSLCADLGRSLAPEAIRPIVESAAGDGLKLLGAQARRALGLALRDAAELTRALEIFEETRAAPYAARVRCERALLTGDRGELEAGMHVLESWAISISWPGWRARAARGAPCPERDPTRPPVHPGGGGGGGVRGRDDAAPAGPLPVAPGRPVRAMRGPDRRRERLRRHEPCPRTSAWRTCFGGTRRITVAADSVE